MRLILVEMRRWVDCEMLVSTDRKMGGVEHQERWVNGLTSNKILNLWKRKILLIR